MKPAIALVGMACRYPDATSPAELWENVVAQRRAFRRLPPERLRLEDYPLEADDAIHTTQAAVLHGYEFDRVRFRVAGSTFRAADMAHWLALDVASDALADAGFAEGDGLPNDSSGVLVGNSLTGEFSRANLMRLRWPYVRRVVDAALGERGWSTKERSEFLSSLEQRYKSPFAPVGDETLAGGLSNTIAGRICNHFDLKGGGYTVDGACTSSLLAVCTACSALTAGDLDVALAGGVDLSLDPFELVGFSKLGALAAEEMRVYDARSAGFWPGEGCGFVVLMRHEDALREHRRVYALVRGWGISSDGRGGITRPEVEGQILALRRAYRRAGFGIDTVALFEGHGTGTVVGDSTELRTLSRARREAASDGPSAAIGSVKANIGHTKAASGVAGLIKATMALQNQLLPPSTGAAEPHPVLAEEGGVLRLLKAAEVWPADQPFRAGVSGMGFGGINTHLALEGIDSRRRKALGSGDRILAAAAGDAELFLLSATDHDSLGRQVQRLLSFASRLSRSELVDLAAQLAKTLNVGRIRAAVVASAPAELEGGLKTLHSWLAEGVRSRLDTQGNVALGSGGKRPAVGFLFPGQGSGANLSRGVWVRRFESVQDIYARANLPVGGNDVATEVVQPAVVTASMAGLRVLDRLGIRAIVGIGHSLGELTAYHWAGAMDEEALLRLAVARGRAIAEFGSRGGAMASIGAGQQAVEALLSGEFVVLAGLNSPWQTIISGEASAVSAITARARDKGLPAAELSVSHAFHSPLVADSVPALANAIAGEEFQSLRSTVASTVTGAVLNPNDHLGELLLRQMDSPVRFMEAVAAVADQVDLWIEVGPGSVLGDIAGRLVDAPVVSLNVDGDSLKDLLRAAGVAFSLGAAVNHRELFEGRFSRPFDLDWQPRFLVNPCELAPKSRTPSSPKSTVSDEIEASPTPTESASEVPNASPLEVIRQLVARRAELPLSSVTEDNRMLDDLHFGSLAVGQLVVEAARTLGLTPSASPTEAANATVGEIAQALAELVEQDTGEPDLSEETLPSGVDSWTRAFTVELVERRIPRHPTDTVLGAWRVIAAPEDPLRSALQEAFDGVAVGKGVVVCLPSEPDERHIELLLEGVQAVLAEPADSRFVLVQHGGGGAAFARCICLELPEVTTCVVDVPWGDPRAVDWIIAENRSAVGYREVYYDESGTRREAVLRLLDLADDGTSVGLDPDDVMLVTGGGKGIAAECAFSLAKETGVRLGLLGRSQPSDDAELTANLERMTAAGIDFHYVSADVTDRAAVRSAVREVKTRLGPVTAVLHGAGRNVPQRLSSLDRETLLSTLGPKVQGARNILLEIEPDQLRLLVTFGSIIARTGMRGQADYALANEWLTRLTERWGAENPHCHCVAVEWSVWSGVGMGERLGTMDALKRQGITPIPPDEGIRMLRRLIGESLPRVPVVVTGRFGEPPTLKLERSELPLLRFLERLRVHVPGVELVAEADLSADTDPYLKDHVYQGVPLFLAVLGLEAMAEAAMALTGTSQPPVFEQVEFEHPIAVPDGRRVTIRVAALVRESGKVEVALRSEETGFQMDHFRAICRINEDRQEIGEPATLLADFADSEPRLPLDPRHDLYGGILFHTGRFQRLSGYRRLRATECIAEIGPARKTDWFSQYLPAELVLGDAAARDAVIHSIQACIPQGTLLPIGVDRIVVTAEATSPMLVRASERSQDGDVFVYDVEVTDADGIVRERWDGLRLRRVGQVSPDETWSELLLGPYLERRIGELIPAASVSVIAQRNGDIRSRSRSDRTIQKVLGEPVTVYRRPDGKPEVCCDREVSVSHVGNLTLAAAGRGHVACDAEPVVARGVKVWRDLLGAERYALAELIAEQVPEDSDSAATRVWSAAECLKKAGASLDVPLVLRLTTADDWVLLAAGPLTVATWLTSLRDTKGRTAVALLAGNVDADCNTRG